MRMQRFWLTIVAVCVVSSGIAQIPDCHIEHFSRELSSRYVETIAQDHLGYIYFGTRNGLCRYDSHEFRFFKSYPGDGCRLSQNRINAISVSSLNHLWCLAHDLRCYLFDPDTERFYDPLAALSFEEESPPLLFDQIYTLPQGITWLVGESWAIRVDENKLRLDAPTEQPLTCYRIGTPQMPGTHVVSICMDRVGNEWLLTDECVQVIGKDKRIEQLGAVSMCVTNDAVWLVGKGGAISRYMNGAVEPRSFRLPAAHGLPRNIEAVNDDLIGISTEQGLSLYDAARNRFEFIPVEGGRVNCFYRDSHGAYWIFSERDGVFRYDPLQKRVSHLQNRLGDQIAENENTLFWHENSKGEIFVVPQKGVMSYYNPRTNQLDLLTSGSSARPYQGRTRNYLVDHQNNIWCAEVEGVSRISMLPGSFMHRRLNAQSDTRAFLYDDQERIWISSRDHTIYLFDSRTNLIGYLAPDGRISATPCLFEAPIYTFEMEEDGRIWMGSRFSGLYRLTPVKPDRYRVERFVHQADDPYSISNDNIYDMHRDRYGRLWVATYGGGLNLVEEQDGAPRFLHAGNELHYPAEQHGQLRVIEETPEGLYLGSTNGLVYFDHAAQQLDAMRFECYSVQEDDSEGLLSNDVRDIHYTSDGELYLLSFSGGLSRLKRNEPGELLFENYTAKEGLPSEQVLSIMEDADGGQWILSETLTFRFDPENGYFEHYGERYSNEEYYFSEAKPMLHGNHLLVGTSDGFCLIPTRESQRSFTPQLRLLSLTVNGEVRRQGLNNLHELKLESHERDLQLSFVALDYANSAAIRYAYRLEGEHEQWQHVGKQRHIHFVDLQCGEHTLHIRSTDSNGRWVENDYVLRVEVKPTFWETPWAWSLYCLIVILLLYLWTRVSRLRSRVAMEQELSNIKLRFFTDISHELRTPLTLISAPIELLLKREKLSDEGRSQMLVVRNNTQRLMTLVNQILDFRKIESKKMRLLLEHTDALQVVCETMNQFDHVSQAHNIDYHLECAVESITGWIDRDKLQKILSNLLSNAFKFTPDGNAIKVRVARVEHQLLLEVIDGGIGIEESDKERLFQRFENVATPNRKTPSTGLGLSLVSELVQLLGGAIHVESTLGVGSRFTVTIPLEKETFDRMTNIDFLLGEEVDAAAMNRSETTTANGEESDEKRRSTILVVEDNEELRTLLRTILIEEYLVLEAVNGEEGLRLARDRQPDLIVSDVLMPVMDGLEMVRHLKEDAATAHMQILILSAKASIEDRIEGLELGVDDYLPKPFHASYFLARVHSLLERRRELQQRLLSEMVVASDRSASHSQEVISPEIRFLNQATAVVERHMDHDDWTIEDFASEMCLSHTSLFQKMKSVVGLSPVEFIREVRLKKACSLIREGSHNIATISYMVGFSDPKYFTRVFKKRFGVPPSQYGEAPQE